LELSARFSIRFQISQKNKKIEPPLTTTAKKINSPIQFFFKLIAKKVFIFCQSKNALFAKVKKESCESFEAIFKENFHPFPIEREIDNDFSTEKLLRNSDMIYKMASELVKEVKTGRIIRIRFI
jgi:hypothetical protein